MSYIRNVAIALDQIAGAVFLRAQPDETVSAWAYRTRSMRMIRFINWLFRDENHCYDSYKAELERTQLPREYRK